MTTLSLPNELMPLIDPISDQNPCGHSLEGTEDYLIIRSLLESTHSANTIENGETYTRPDWSKIYQTCLKCLSQSKDVILYLGLCRSALYCQGILGFAQAWQLFTENLETFWDSLHPLIDVEDNSAYERIGLLDAFEVPSLFLKDFVSTGLLYIKNNSVFCLNDYKDSTQKNYSLKTEKAISELKINLACLDLNTTKYLLKSISSINLNYDKIKNLVREKNDQESIYLPKFINRLSVVENIFINASVLNEPKKNINPDSVKIDQKPCSPNNNSMNTNSEPTEINSRIQVIKAMELIITYYQQHEPSSPIPDLIQRCKRAVNMNFFELIQEFAPNALDQIKHLSGQKSLAKED